MTPGPEGVGVRYVVAGAGGMGCEALAWARDAWPAATVVGFWTAADGSGPRGLSTDLPVLTDVWHAVDHGATHVVLGIGDGSRRHRVSDEAKAAGLEMLTVIHPTVFLGPGVIIGDGAIVAPRVLLSRDVVVGEGAIINCGVVVGHGGRVGEFAFLGPAAALAGDVSVGDGALVGIGAVILPGRQVGIHAVVGAGSVVVNDVAENSCVVGNPARVRTPGLA